jgi:hypothetical protein
MSANCQSLRTHTQPVVALGSAGIEVTGFHFATLTSSTERFAVLALECFTETGKAQMQARDASSTMGHEVFLERLSVLQQMGHEPSSGNGEPERTTKRQRIADKAAMICNPPSRADKLPCELHVLQPELEKDGGDGVSSGMKVERPTCFGEWQVFRGALGL